MTSYLRRILVPLIIVLLVGTGLVTQPSVGRPSLVAIGSDTDTGQQPGNLIWWPAVCPEPDEGGAYLEMPAATRPTGVVNASVPVPHLSLDPSSDTGISNSDHLTGNNMPVVIGQAQTGSRVTLFDDGHPMAFLTADQNGNWALALNACAALADGKHSITAQSSNGTGELSAFSAALTLTIVTKAPSMPVIASPASHSNIEGSQVPIFGTAGPNLAITILDGNSVFTTVESNSQGAWGVTLNGVAPGTHNYHAYATDLAGNESPSFKLHQITVTKPLQSSTSNSGQLNTNPSGFSTNNPPNNNGGGNGKGNKNATPTPTSTPTAMNMSTPTATITDTPTAVSTSTSTPMPAPADTPTSTPTSTRVPSPSPTATMMPAPTSTNLPTATNTLTPTLMDTPTATPTPTTASPVIAMAAGDIACGTGSGGDCQQMATSNLLISGSPSIVLPLGDDQYECGSLSDFSTYYDPSWGIVKNLTHPSVGNHEYQTSTDPSDPCYQAPAGAPGYFTYFGSSASPDQPGCTSGCSGYYSYNAGAWHIVVLNSVCSQVGGCGLGSPEEVWLKNDLAANPAPCTLAYWHYPRYTSGLSGTTFLRSLSAFWQDLYNAGAEIILNGHDHDYERFAPMNANGHLDMTYGIREFVVGTGGKSHQGESALAANSEVQNFDTFGVLQLTLNSNSFSWQFMPVAGSTFTDSGSQNCH